MTSLFLALLFAVDVDLTSSWVTDADLERVGRMAGVTRLDLSQTKITDAGLERLKNLKELRELRLYYAEFLTEDGLAILKHFPQLERLDLRGTRVTSKVFEHIAHLKNLRALDLGFTEIIDDGFDQLTELPRLEKLVIGGNRLSGECLSLLLQIPSLRDLDVGGTQRVDSGLWGLALTEQNLERLGALTQLHRLNLAAATISDRGVDRPGHPEAERIDLPDLSALTALENLEYLDLTRQPVSAAALKSIERLPRLTELRLGLSRNLGDSAADVLLGMKNLRKVYLTGSRMSPEGLEKIQHLLTQSR